MIQQYKDNLLTSASALDVVVHGNGKYTQLATAIIEETEDKAAKELCVNLARLVNNGQITEPKSKKIVQSLKECLIDYLGYQRLEELYKREENQREEDKKTLSQLLDDLNNLIGLPKVKRQVRDLISFQKIQLLRKQFGLHSPQNTMHLSLTGNPGTGKTTVARIIGRIYKQIGLLSKGHFVEVSRTDLIAGYQGQTALKVKKVIEKAKGGVLFIDEAYSITENEHTDSYGRECLTELTKALEDYRDDLVVIVAGYTEPMKDFFKSNPGLKSRFNTFIEFDDYNDTELYLILESMLKKYDYFLDESATSETKSYFKKVVENKQEQFANGRFVRNFFDDITMNHARRVSNIENPSIEDLRKIKVTDLALDSKE